MLLAIVKVVSLSSAQVLAHLLLIIVDWPAFLIQIHSWRIWEDVARMDRHDCLTGETKFSVFMITVFFLALMLSLFSDVVQGLYCSCLK